MSLEKEVFPFMAQDAELFAFDLEGKSLQSYPLLMSVCMRSRLSDTVKDQILHCAYLMTK